MGEKQEQADRERGDGLSPLVQCGTATVSFDTIGVLLKNPVYTLTCLAKDNDTERAYEELWVPFRQTLGETTTLREISL